MGKTLAQKIFDAHEVDRPAAGVRVLSLDRVFCHEITTPIAVNDLAATGRDRVFDRDKIKVVIDHVSPAKDSKTAEQGKTLRDWVRRQGIKDFFDIGYNGVCHAIFPEKGFVRPGFTVIMGDSHTCTHGAFGAFAAGIGTTDLEVGILKGVCAFREPKTLRVEVEGALRPGVFAKDVILTIIKELTVNGATDQVMEFAGSTVDAMSMESRMTLCNMAIEAGATCGVCQPDLTTVEYLWPFIKDEFKDKQAALAEYSKFRSDADAEYTRVLKLDAAKIEPVATVKYKPDQEDRPRARGHAHRSGLHRQLHQRADRRPAGRREHPQRQAHRADAARDRLARDERHLPSGAPRRPARDLRRRGLLRDQRDLRRVPRHEQRRPRQRRSLREHHQPQLQRPHGQGRDAPSDEPGDGGGDGARGPHHQLGTFQGLTEEVT